MVFVACRALISVQLLTGGGSPRTSDPARSDADLVDSKADGDSPDESKPISKGATSAIDPAGMKSTVSVTVSMVPCRRTRGEV